MEAIGDTTASAEVSRQDVSGDVFDSRIQGGVLVRNLPLWGTEARANLPSRTG